MPPFLFRRLHPVMRFPLNALLLMTIVMSFAFTWADCTRGLLGGGGGDSGGGGPTPTPSHTWLSLPGCCDFFADWGGGDPDHHDGGEGTHAVDIDINGAYCNAGTHECTYDSQGHTCNTDTPGCTPNCGGVCPDVFYYDKSGSVSAPMVTRFPWSCASHVGGGEKLEFDLFSFDPYGQLAGNVKYLHLQSAIQTGVSIMDGMRLGTVAAVAGWDCWTGPHLHQQIAANGPATLLHMTGTGNNCVANGPAAPTVPCYSLSW